MMATIEIFHFEIKNRLFLRMFAFSMKKKTPVNTLYPCQERHSTPILQENPVFLQNIYGHKYEYVFRLISISMSYYFKYILYYITYVCNA